MNRLIIIRFLLIFSIFSCSFVVVFGQNDSIRQYTLQKKTNIPAPVIPFRDTLFHIRTGIGSFSSQERAVSIAEKIRFVCREYSGFHSDSLDISSEGGLLVITYRDVIIMSVTENDAKLNGMTQLALAKEYEDVIKNAIVKHNKDTGWLTVMFRVFMILLIVAALYFLIKIVNKFFRKLSSNIEKLKGTKIKTIKIKSYILMDEEKSTKLILLIVSMMRYALILLLLYLSIPMALRVFPATRNYATVLFSYVLTPFTKILHGIIGYVPNLITIIVIVLVFRYIIRGLRFFAEEIDKGRLTVKGFYPDWAHPTFSIIKALLYAFMLVVIWEYLPFSDSDAFKGVSIFFGVIFSLGSSSVINNIVSGLVLTYMRPFNIGDRIKIGDLTGNVVEKTPLVTRIRTPKNEEVTIPNSNIMTAQTFNYSQSARTYGLILHTTVTIGYETPWRKVHEMLLEAAKRTPDVKENPKPFILQTALDDFYANYQINVYISDADKMPRIYSALHQNIQDVFNENGVEITSPQYHAQRDGNQITIPPSYLPDDYEIPSLRVKIEKNL